MVHLILLSQKILLDNCILYRHHSLRWQFLLLMFLLLSGTQQSPLPKVSRDAFKHWEQLAYMRMAEVRDNLIIMKITLGQIFEQLLQH